MPRRMSRKARARSRSMPPSRPAFFSWRAHQVIRWSAASTSAGRQLPAGQAGVPGRLRPPLHPRLLRRMLPALARLLRVDLHDRAADRRPQPRRGQGPGPVQDHGLRGAGLGGVQQHGGRRDDLRLTQGQHPGPERRPGPGQADLQRRRQGQHFLGVPGRQGQRGTQLPGEELIPLPPAARTRRLSGVPGAGRRRSNSATAACLRALALASTRSHPQITPEQLIIGRTRIAVTLPAASSANWASTGPPGARPAAYPTRTPRPGSCTRRGTSARSRASPGRGGR